MNIESHYRDFIAQIDDAADAADLDDLRRMLAENIKVLNNLSSMAENMDLDWDDKLAALLENSLDGWAGAYMSLYDLIDKNERLLETQAGLEYEAVQVEKRAWGAERGLAKHTNHIRQ